MSKIGEESSVIIVLGSMALYGICMRVLQILLLPYFLNQRAATHVMPGPLPAGVDTLLATAANSRVGREGGRERAEQSVHVASVF